MQGHAFSPARPVRRISTAPERMTSTRPSRSPDCASMSPTATRVLFPYTSSRAICAGVSVGNIWRTPRFDKRCQHSLRVLISAPLAARQCTTCCGPSGACRSSLYGEIRPLSSLQVSGTFQRCRVCQSRRRYSTVHPIRAASAGPGCDRMPFSAIIDGRRIQVTSRDRGYDGRVHDAQAGHAAPRVFRHRRPPADLRAPHLARAWG